MHISSPPHVLHAHLSLLDFITILGEDYRALSSSTVLHCSGKNNNRHIWDVTSSRRSVWTAV
jgi:hypothetical protein